MTFKCHMGRIIFTRCLAKKRWGVFCWSRMNTCEASPKSRCVLTLAKRQDWVVLIIEQRKRLKITLIFPLLSLFMPYFSKQPYDKMRILISAFYHRFHPLINEVSKWWKSTPWLSLYFFFVPVSTRQPYHFRFAMLNNIIFFFQLLIKEAGLSYSRRLDYSAPKHFTCASWTYVEVRFWHQTH